MIAFCIFFLISVLFVILSNESETTSEKSDKNSISAVTNSDAYSTPEYDAAMDPLTIGATFSKKWGDTLNVKMFEVSLEPGDSIALHTHPDHTIYVIKGGKMAFYFQGGGRDTSIIQSGVGWIGGPITDVVKNIGNASIKWLEVDIYRPRE